MRMRMKRLNRRRGFTLLEVLMVIVILGVIAAVVIAQLGKTGEGARIDATKVQIKGLDTQMELYKMHCGEFPTELRFLIVKPDDEAMAEHWRGPYVKEMPKDGWGYELKYRFPGTVNQGGYDLYSTGPNHREGDEDDIGNWEKTR